MEVNHPYLTQQRHGLFRALLKFTAPAVALHGGLNIYFGVYLLAWLSAGAILVLFGLLVAMQRSAPLDAVALTYLFSLFILIAATLLFPAVYPGMHGWLGTFPVAAYLLLRIRVARPFTFISLCVATGAYLLGETRTSQTIDILELANAVIPAVLLFVIFDLYAHARVRTEEEMVERAFSDPLTGLGNRAQLKSDFEREQRRSKRTGMPLSLLLIDLDRFKELNDRYGHDAGDAALVFFADLVRQRIRQSDLACRFGGEEFAILLSNTAAADAVKVAEDLRRSLELSTLNYQGASMQMTLCAGVVELGRDGDDWLQLYRAADARLYACKERGRNRVLSSLARPNRDKAN
jgi:diguanylate cyclase (GGDEF)-like protein